MNQSSPDNLSLYEKVRAVPENAQRPIAGGNLKGKTDINPMWRIKTLTEQFGVCGFGWKTITDKKWLETAPDGRIAAFCDITLYVKVNGEWSDGIQGNGGSMFVDLANGQQKASDECYKMAYTDALSVCCKLLGVGADVYWEKDATKYSNPNESNNPNQPEPKSEEPKKSTPKPIYACEDCGELFKPFEFGGIKYTAEDAYNAAFERRKAHICQTCDKKRKAGEA